MSIIHKSTKESCCEALIALANSYEKMVVLDCCRSNESAIFAKNHPTRYIDFGFTGSNAIGVASGLAICGVIPVAICSSDLIAGRVFEQISNSVARHNLNVKIIAKDGDNPISDLELISTIPQMTVIFPSDDTETRSAVKNILEHNGPVYLRVASKPTMDINDKPEYSFKIGCGILQKSGSDLSIFTSGTIVHDVLDIAQLLEDNKVSAEVISLHTIRPIDRQMICESAKRTGRVVTIESGIALGNAIACMVSGQIRVPVLQIDTSNLDIVSHRSSILHQILTSMRGK